MFLQHLTLHLSWTVSGETLSGIFGRVATTWDDFGCRTLRALLLAEGGGDDS